MSRDLERVWKHLSEHGWLLLSDPELPSVSGMVAREPVRGSWWSHPRAHAIYAVSQDLSHHQDVLVAKLVSRKVTFLHRDLWRPFLSVARSREPWQMKGLPVGARSLLRRVESDGVIEPEAGRSLPKKSVDALEYRLLAHVEQVHTESGAHARLLESWDRWRRRARHKGRALTPASARRRLEEAVQSASAGVPLRLPWL